MKIYFALLVLLLGVTSSEAQYNGNIWCFGDSALIDFTGGNPVTGRSSAKVRGSNCSIVDNLNHLLFYAHTFYVPVWMNGGDQLGVVWNSNHQIMQNGDSLIAEGWYNEMIIIPDPANSNQFYLFHIDLNTAGLTGFYYSKIDLSYNGGLGKVISKNLQLLSDPMTDCLDAVKHGNGRDWWVICRSSGVFTGNNTYYKYLITPSGISGPFIQSIGSVNNTNSGRLTFNHKGDKILFLNLINLTEEFDFDRCNGQLSSPVTITSQINTYVTGLWSAEFSPSDSLLYVSKGWDTTYLVQYNLYAANIAASADTLTISTFPAYNLGALKSAPDGKIYFSRAWYDGINFNFPYPDTTYNMYNSYLSLINYPDSIGAACDFQPYSFYLGGARTYYGLPNNPDYEMGKWVGSPCDTLTGIANIEKEKTNAILFVFYHSAWQTVFINAQNLKGEIFEMNVFDMMGNLVHHEQGKLTSEYFTRDLNCNTFAKGMYIVNFKTEKEILTKKFIKD